MSSTTIFSITSPGSRGKPRYLVLGAILTVEVLILLLPGIWWGIAALAMIATLVMFGLVIAVVRGRGDTLILAWLLIFPLGYYCFSYPREGALFTLDRFFIAVLFTSAWFALSANALKIPFALRKSGICWGIFLFFAGLAAFRAATPLSSFRIWLEAFTFPALLAWYVLRYFDVRKLLAPLHAFTCLMALYVVAIGVAEAILVRDLLPLPGGGFVVAGDYTDTTAQILPRPNGPFATNNSFAMIGLVSLFFLMFLGRAMGKMPAWQTMLHRLGVSAALLEAVMPLFRSVLASLALVILIDAIYERGWRRTIRVAAIACLAFAFLSLRLLLPSVFEERAESGTLYARIAQQKQTLSLFADNPINGIGLSNFSDALQSGKYATYYEDQDALDSAHNNLGAVLAETGITGFVPFVASQVFLVIAFWRLPRAQSSDSLMVWRFFIFLFVCYWLNGMALMTAYFADLNLWYMCVLAVLYKFAATGRQEDAAMTGFARLA